jgi:hypothetical protein
VLPNDLCALTATITATIRRVATERSTSTILEVPFDGGGCVDSKQQIALARGWLGPGADARRAAGGFFARADRVGSACLAILQLHDFRSDAVHLGLSEHTGCDPPSLARGFATLTAKILAGPDPAP